jgi:hypothetical protein
MYSMKPMALRPFQKKLCCGFLLLLKIHWPWPGLSLRTFGPVASTLTTRSPRETGCYITLMLLYQKCVADKLCS